MDFRSLMAFAWGPSSRAASAPAASARDLEAELNLTLGAGARPPLLRHVRRSEPLAAPAPAESDFATFWLDGEMAREHPDRPRPAAYRP